MQDTGGLFGDAGSGDNSGQASREWLSGGEIREEDDAATVGADEGLQPEQVLQDLLGQIGRASCRERV